MKTVLSTSVLIATVILWGCGSKTEEKKEPENGIEALQQFADKAKEMQDKKAVDPVDFRKLKELLPSKAAGIAQKEAGGEKNGAMGFTISKADARYEEESGSSIDIDILDTGGIGGMAMMGLAAWSIAEIDKETADGYEKTTKIDGYKGYEKYNTNGKYGEISVFVAERFIVNVKGNNITIDQLKDALGDIDLDKLKGLQ